MLEELKKLLNRECSKIFVIKKRENNKEVIIGYAVVWITCDEAEIHWIEIFQEYRGKGFGRKLLQDILEFLKENENIRKIFLEVDEENKKALSLYRSLGFTPLYVRQNYYGEGKRAIVMVY